MIVPELFTMLNPKNIRFDVGSGGIPAMTADDLSAAIGMAKLPRSHYILMRVKYCGDATMVRELSRHIHTECLALSKRQGWKKSNKPDIYQRLANLSLWHEIDPQRCRACGGTGMGNHTITCKVCLGLGASQSMSNRKRARICGVDEKAWRNTWNERHSDLNAIVGEWEIVATKKIAEKLFRECA